jgi:pyruvate dehydrogenase E1 component alpha subunit
MDGNSKSKKSYVNIDSFKVEDKFRQLDDKTKIEMLRKMYQIRHFEDETEQFIIRGMIHGTCHLYTGEEAIAVGAINAIKSDDYITSTHRGHGHCIAKGSDINSMMAELLGKRTGYCKGKGGSMHIADIDSGNLGANGVVGGSIGIATGAALTCRMKKNGKITVCFFGDGAANLGIFHSSINMASIWKLPIIYLCENNVYGMSTSVKESLNIERISERKTSYGIEGLTIDGNNLIEVFNTVSHFAEECRRGRGPVLIESLTYRWKGHSKSDAQVYRKKEELKRWMEKDPIVSYRKTLKSRGVLTEEMDKGLEKEVIDQMKKAIKYAKDSPFPKPSEVEEDVYA